MQTTNLKKKKEYIVIYQVKQEVPGKGNHLLSLFYMTQFAQTTNDITRTPRKKEKVRGSEFGLANGFATHSYR
jgi:hypothetical protein